MVKMEEMDTKRFTSEVYSKDELLAAVGAVEPLYLSIIILHRKSGVTLFRFHYDRYTCEDRVKAIRRNIKRIPARDLLA